MRGASSFGFRKKWWLGSFQSENHSTFGQPLEVARVSLADRRREACELARVGLAVAGRRPERRTVGRRPPRRIGRQVEHHAEALVGGAPHDVVVGAEPGILAPGPWRRTRACASRLGARRHLAPLQRPRAACPRRCRRMSRSVCSRRCSPGADQRRVVLDDRPRRARGGLAAGRRHRRPRSRRTTPTASDGQRGDRAPRQRPREGRRASPCGSCRAACRSSRMRGTGSGPTPCASPGSSRSSWS